MAIELPGPVADFLGFIGINWPNVNEDHVREFGQHIAQFAQSLQSNHQDATGTVEQVGQAYSGESYERLFAVWGEMSSTHLNELLTACNVLSTGLDVGADVIIGEKLAAIAQLIVMAAEFIADQAAAVATFGLAEAALALIEEEGQQVVKFLEQKIEQYIEGQIVNAALTPLIDKAVSLVEGLVYQGTAAALGESGRPSVSIDPPTVISLAAKFDTFASASVNAGSTLSAGVSGLSFE